MFITPTAVFLSFFLVVATTASPPTPSSKRQAMAQVITKCTKPNTTALTFDDGPYQYLREIVDTLDNAGAKGTFFFNGNNWGRIYDKTNIANVQYAYSKGHMVASHTWSHLDLSQQNEGTLESEMDRLNEALERIVGVTSAYMRPPYGNYNDLVRKVAASRGLTLVNWDFDDGDSTGSSAEASEQDYADLADRHPSTILALNHETYQTTAEQVLPFALNALKGYQFVTAAECLGVEPYQKVGKPQVQDSTWTC